MPVPASDVGTAATATIDGGGQDLTTRTRLLPAAKLPLWYFAFAHVCLGLAFAALVVRPDLPGGYFHHPRMLAIVHLLTLGWITSSILGAIYIVGPLALRIPLRPHRIDGVAFGAYASGVSGIVSHFWIGEYSGMAWSAVLVIAAILHVAIRIWAGLVPAAIPAAVKVHVMLAFGNLIAAGLLGTVVALNRMFTWYAWSPMSAAFAHAHLAAVGGAVMMVIGLSYRLIPMIVPAAMPTGGSLATSAVLLEVGVIALAIGLLRDSPWVPAAAFVIVAGLATFVWHVRAIVKHRLPPPAALPRPDWATWQTHVAFLWLLVAAATGLVLTLPISRAWMIPLGWAYGVAGLVGFLAQVVMGIQGRLLPLHGWYRMFEGRGLKPPARSAHTLASPALARIILMTWAGGVPLLLVGLASGRTAWISISSAFLLAGVAANAVQAIQIAGADANPDVSVRP